MNWNLTSKEIWSEPGTCGPQLVAVLKKNFENLFTTTLVVSVQVNYWEEGLQIFPAVFLLLCLLQVLVPGEYDRD